MYHMIDQMNNFFQYVMLIIIYDNFKLLLKNAPLVLLLH